MKRKTKILIGAAALVLVLGVGSAEALRIRAGDLLVIGDGGFRPTKLPKHHNAPITIYGGGHIETVSGNPPPIIDTITSVASGATRSAAFAATAANSAGVTS